MKLALLLALVATIFAPVFAGDKAEAEKWMKQAREKEMRRAKEAAQHNGNIEHIEKKYGWLKKDHADKYADMITKRKAAAEAWKKVAESIAKAKTYDDFHALKAPAYDAEAAAELARLELKAEAAEKDWNHAAKKTGSATVAATAKKLIRNQKAILEATKKKMANDKQLRQLEVERNSLNKKMRLDYEKAKKGKHRK